MADCGPQPPSDPWGPWFDWYTCFYNNSSSADQTTLGNPDPPPPPPPPPAATTPPATTPTKKPPAKTGTPPRSAPGSSPLNFILDPGDTSDGGGGPTLDDYCSQYPEDAICNVWFWGGTGTVTTGGGLGGTETIIVQNSGVSALDVNAIVDASLSGLWGSLTGILDTLFAGFVSGILTALTAIGNALKNVFNVLSRLGGLILKALQAMWENILKAVVAGLKAVEALLKDLYDDVIKPMIGSIQHMRQWLLDLYKNYLRPLIVWLQYARKILAILKLFHIGFATKLDNALADIQARITGPLLTILGMVNGVANWINLIVTANYLLQKPLFLASLNAYKGEAINLQLNAMNQPISAGGAAAIAAQTSTPSATQSVVDLHTFLTVNSGPVTTYATDYGAVLQAALQGTVKEPAQ